MQSTPAAQPAPIAPPSAPQTAPTAPATAAPTQAPTRYGVSLDHAVETVRTTIELGARQGFSQARIELSPPSLGTIKIQLHRSDDGVTAHVVTDSAATADTLAQNGDDLRRSLQQAGVNLLSLNIQARADGGAQTHDRPAHAPSPRADRTHSDQADFVADVNHESTTLVLPGGARINVLA